MKTPTLVEGVHCYFKKDGEKIYIGNIAEYCRENGLNPNCFSRIRTGRDFSYRGYTCHALSSEVSNE